MTLIQIKLINGEPMGRPVNPKAAQKVICDAWTGDSYPKCSNLAICDCEKYRQFEQSVTTYPAPGLEDWEVEAELQWQAFSNGDWIDFNNGYSAEYYYKDNIPTRQIWRLSPSLKEAEVKQPVNLSNKLNDVRQQAMDVILNAMSGYKDYHFPLMQVSWLKSFVTNPQYCNHVTKGNLELWSTDSLCSLADTLNNLYNPPQ